jgi:hypothetical protein
MYGQQIMLQQVPGHPWAQCAVTADAYAPARIHCRCLACGDVWQHECQHPARAQSWIYKYAAQHAHGNEGLQQAFSEAYVREHQKFMMQMRGW